MNNQFQNVFWFIGILIFQLFIIDAIDIGVYSIYFTPIIFSFFILKQRLETSIFKLLLFAFLMGMTIDIFRNTLGLNTSVLLLLAILRSKFLVIISSKDEFESGLELNLFTLGLGRYIIYFGLSILFHHFLFFLVEQFSFVNILTLMFRSLVNTVFALLLLALFQYAIIPKK
jgi:hypothetical protein